MYFKQDVLYIISKEYYWIFDGGYIYIGNIKINNDKICFFVLKILDV